MGPVKAINSLCFRVIVLFFLLKISPLSAKVWNVDVNGNGDYTSIQECITNASTGDSIVVYDGVYNENDIDFNGKSLILTSLNGPENCKITDKDGGSVVWFHSGEPSTSILEGFTIENDLPDDVKGGGIAVESGTPTISNCIIKGTGTQNGATGGAIYIKDSSPVITGCIIENWLVDDGIDPAEFTAGAAIYLENSSAKINNTVIRNNGIYFYDTGSNEEGGIIYISETGSSNIEITNCTIINNQIKSGGRAIIQCDDGTTTINGTILWNNSGYSSHISENLNVKYSCIQGGYQGEGNISSDPLLISDDYHLSSQSPCIDSGVLETSIDIDQEPRPYSFLSRKGDIGADEFTFCHSPPKEILINTTINDSLENSTKINFYEINLNNSHGFLKLYTTGQADTIGYLVDESGCGSSSWITNDDNSGSDQNFYIEYPYAHFSEKIYIAVRQSSDTQKSYTLHAELITDPQGNTCKSAVDNSKIFNENYFSTSEIYNIPQSGTASIDFNGDEDSFKISVSKPGTLMIFTQINNGITAVLKDSQCGALAFPDEYTGDNFIITHANYEVSQQDYYIQVFARSQESPLINNYNIKVIFFPNDDRVDSFFKIAPQTDWSGLAIKSSGSHLVDPDLGSYSLTSMGGDIIEKADSFYFLNKPVTGDCILTAKVESINGSDPAAKAGLMLRNSLTSYSRFGFSTISRNNNFNFLKREVDGNSSSSGTVTSISLPIYIKIRKEDNLFTAFHSSDGLSWTEHPDQSEILQPFKESFYAGITSSSNLNNEDSTAIFKEVDLDSTDIVLNDSSPESGDLTIPGDKDFFEIETPSYGNITIETLNSGKKIYFTIYNIAGEDITDRSGEEFTGNNYRLTQKAGKGNFFIEVKPQNDMDFAFQYNIKTDYTDIDDEAGNSMQTATWLEKWFGSAPLVYFDFIECKSNYSGDEDYFRLNVEYPGYLTIMADKLSQELTSGITAQLINDQGEVISEKQDIRIIDDIVSNTDYSPANPPANAFEIKIQPGTYYIKLKTDQLDTSYRLAVDFDDFGDSGKNNPEPFTEFNYPVINGKIETTSQGQHSGEDADAFEIKVPAGDMRIKVYTTGESNTYGVLKSYNQDGSVKLEYNGNGSLPGFDPNYDSKGNFQYIYPPYENSNPEQYKPLEPGESYFIELSMEDWQKTGEYRLHMELIDMEPDTCELANEIIEGEPAKYKDSLTPVENKVISGFADTDMFKFVAPKTGIVEIWTTGNYDTRGELKNSNCTTIAFNDDADAKNKNENFKIVHPVFSETTYYIAVEHYKIYDTGVYSLNIRINDSNQDLEGNSIAKALDLGSISHGNPGISSTGHRFEYYKDKDFYKIDVNSDGILHINTSGDCDTHGSLLTSRGDVLCLADDNSTGKNFKLSFKVSDGETYYLRVSSLSGVDSSANYAISATLESTQDRTPDSIREIPQDVSGISPPQLLTGESIEFQGDFDVYKILIEEQKEYSFYTAGSLDTYGVLYDENSQVIAASDDGAPDNSKNFIIKKILTPGIFYLRVSAFNNSDTGLFDLILE